MSRTAGGRFSDKDPNKSVSLVGFGVPEKPPQKARVGAAGGSPSFGGPATFRSYDVAKDWSTRRQQQFGSQFPAISFEAIARNGNPLAFLKPARH